MAFHKNGYSVNIRLPEEVFQLLKKKAKADETSMSYIVRRALKNSGELRGGKAKKTANR